MRLTPQPYSQLSKGSDPSTDSIDLSALSESGLTQTFDAESTEAARQEKQESLAEANVILIAHPDGKRLGTRFQLKPGSVLDVGRSSNAAISLPEVLSISRRHARLRYEGKTIALEDLGSTNGTYVNGAMVVDSATLSSGDRFQVAAVHFKFLHERDVEHAYYEAIYDLVTRDGLTEIFNKRKYDEEADREFARALRHRRPLSLIIFDLDQFKEVNDQYGHLCGDFVLKQVTSRIQALVRPDDILARVGGDEFVILTPETASSGARSLAERVRLAVAELAYPYAGFEIQLSCSLGVAEIDDDMRRPSDLFAAADRALYRAKNAGRNRVAVHGG